VNQLLELVRKLFPRATPKALAAVASVAVAVALAVALLGARAVAEHLATWGIFALAILAGVGVYLVETLAPAIPPAVVPAPALAPTPAPVKSGLSYPSRGEQAEVDAASLHRDAQLASL
jgi:hypothetical protein